MDEAGFWALEEGFWLKGRSHYQAHFSVNGICAFPSPMGFMIGNSFLEHLPEEGGFADVEISEKSFHRPHPVCAVLAYRGTGKRHGDDSVSMLCTSTYVQEDEVWRLVQHSQIPAE